MRRSLFLCNTVYQVLIAMWMKHVQFPDDSADIILSDHMNGGEEIVKKIRQYGEFDNCYFVKSRKFTLSRFQSSPTEDRQIRLMPHKYLKNFVDLHGEYSDIYLANPDVFSELLHNALMHTNKNVELHLFEDGLSSYSRLFEEYYEDRKLPELDMLHTWIRKLFGETGIYGNVKELYLFCPEDICWNPPFPVKEIQKIDQQDYAFVEMCNRVFGYYESQDKYEKKYIFMEESFAADGNPINDVELLEQLALRVGKENIMIKIHPRNPVNRFAECGFATNVNTAIPWEVILMNLEDVSDKVFLTVASSSVLNPLRLFNANCKGYSLYNLVDKEKCNSQLLRGEFWETVYSIMQKYPRNFTLCNSIDEIQ